MSVRTKLVACIGSAALALIAAPVAGAHVSVSSTNMTAGGYGVLSINVPHGCNGNATTKIEMQLPEGTTSFTPGRTAFWTGTVTTKKLDTPLKGEEGEEISDVPDTVTFTASKPLPDGMYESIPSSIKLPDTEGVVYFPVVQSCEKNTSTEWTQIPEADAKAEPEHPAGELILTANMGEDHHGNAAEEAEHDKDASEAPRAEAKDMSGVSTKQVANLQDDVDSARMLGIAGIIVGALGLLFGLGALRRGRTS